MRNIAENSDFVKTIKSGAGAIPKKRYLHSSVTVIDNKLIDSQAFLALTSHSKSGYPALVYLHFLQKRIAAKKTKREKNKTPRFVNGRELTFSYEEARLMGINHRAFNIAIDALIEHGFIDIIKHGNGLIKGDCTVYGLSDRWEQYGTPDFQHVARQKVRFGFCEQSKHTVPCADGTQINTRSREKVKDSSAHGAVRRQRKHESRKPAQ